MNGLVLKRLTGGALIALAAVACTASPYLPEEKFAEASEARLVIVTGSRIPQMVDMSDASPATRSPVRIITSNEIAAQGASSLTDVLGFYSFPSSEGH